MTSPNSKFGYSWIFLTLALALHVIDEAIFGFLPFYNSVVLNAREEFQFFPFPTFSFQSWITGLIIAICILLALGWFAFQGRKWIIVMSYLFGTIMILNGSLHILGSLYYDQPIPGVWSSPLLIIASVSLLWTSKKKASQYIPIDHDQKR